VGDFLNAAEFNVVEALRHTRVPRLTAELVGTLSDCADILKFCE
jgi:hypothetical protein